MRLVEFWVHGLPSLSVPWFDILLSVLISDRFGFFKFVSRWVSFLITYEIHQVFLTFDLDADIIANKVLIKTAVLSG